MSKRVVLVVLCLVVGLGVTACQRQAAGPTTVLIVRHGEKASEDADAPLSDAGRMRAAALSGAAGDAGVAAIYTSHTKFGNIGPHGTTRG
jgi:hypothetical protein